jgi:hypothetical protein
LDKAEWPKSLKQFEMMTNRVQLQKHNFVEAKTISRNVVQIREQNAPGNQLDIAKAKGLLGESLKEQKRYSEAEPLMVAAYRAYKTKLGVNHPYVIESKGRLNSLYNAWGKPAGNY